MRVFDRDQKFDENDTHTHRAESSVIIIITAGPKRRDMAVDKKATSTSPVNMAEDREDDTPFPFRRL
ncbi:hypothetical protein GHT06_014266 [Daphnia sinensis]|uniref:Uncharacterized protein n=1 Tax=Daphnia sinensis TaxID=1820382 RepID=A0AAD5PV21_9CRUS|nr:hypothetical protein GHT06_014266 [Daphnia sinensis]